MVETRMVPLARLVPNVVRPILCWLVLFAAIVAASFDFVAKPEFGEKPSDLNVTIFAGQTGRLPCTVKHLSGKRVSWIRGRDLQVLSTGRITFSTDQRISVLPGTTKFKARRPRGAEALPCHACRRGRRRRTPAVPRSLGAPRDARGPRRGARGDCESGRTNGDCYRYYYHYYYNYYRAKKSLNGLSRASQHGGRPRHEHDQHSGKYYGGGAPQAHGRHDGPIAIYPQGPASHGAEGKGLQPGPNYIEGVWEPEDYTLQIKFTRPEDAGIYICQINTEPKVSQEIRLSVVKMRAEIIGRSELFVKAGTAVTLACRVNHGPLMPGFILWYKGERLVEYDRSGGRIRVVTGVEGVSHLLLQDATPSDSANYTCSPSGGVPASLILNVIVDERQAAMQQGNSAPPSSPKGMLLLPAAAAALLTMLSSLPSEETRLGSAVGGVVWAAAEAAVGGSSRAHFCWPTPEAATAVLTTVAMLSAAPLTPRLTGALPRPRKRRSCVPAPCHIQRGVVLVVGVSLCAALLLLCHSSRLQNYV